MPKYTNAGASVVSIGSLRLEPGETKTTLEFIPGSLPAGVTEVTSAPAVNPIISSTKLTGNGTVTVPETYTDPSTGVVHNLTGNYLVSVYVATGECTVQFNSIGTARYVGLYETFTYRCLSRVVDTVVLVVSGTTYVTVEAV
jgi:hypothetical protein